MSPRLSVVVPAYNNAAVVAETIRSVLAQTFDDYELVVADHASQDGTWEVLQQFADDPRVRLLQTPAGGGARANWDAVSQAATGELVKLVCGDDLLYPRMLEVQVAAFDRHPRAEVVASKRDIVDAAGKPLVRGAAWGGCGARSTGPRRCARPSAAAATCSGSRCA